MDKGERIREKVAIKIHDDIKDYNLINKNYDIYFEILGRIAEIEFLQEEILNDYQGINNE